MSTPRHSAAHLCTCPPMTQQCHTRGVLGRRIIELSGGVARAPRQVFLVAQAQPWSHLGRLCALSSILRPSQGPSIEPTSPLRAIVQDSRPCPARIKNTRHVLGENGPSEGFPWGRTACVLLQAPGGLVAFELPRTGLPRSSSGHAGRVRAFCLVPIELRESRPNQGMAGRGKFSWDACWLVPACYAE